VDLNPIKLFGGNKMVSMNRVILAGNLARDPELKETSNGSALTIFPVAVSRSWKDNAGDKQKQTSFYRIIVWNNAAKNCARYLKKGRAVLVEGRLDTRSIELESGEKKYYTQIVGDRVTFLSKPEQVPPSEESNEPAIF
jgi:single-strand DNA-binding protein